MAAATGTSHQQIARFEAGDLDRLSISRLGSWCATVGLDLAVRGYPAGDPLRDRAQLVLLERLRGRLHPSLGWRTEVPLAIDGDLRAWDAVITGLEPEPWIVRVEGESRVGDGQALERRLRLKVRDDPHGGVLLLVADTRWNRDAIVTLAPGLHDLLPDRSRAILAALAAGRQPPSGIVVL